MNRSGHYYYQLSLRTRRQPPKKVCFKYKSEILEVSGIVNKILKMYAIVKSGKRKQDNVSVVKLIERIIPLEYFGTIKNRKLFNSLVEKILTQSCYECVFKQSIYKEFDLDAIGWLESIPEQKREKFLHKINLFLLDSVVKQLIAFYYKPVKTFNGNEIKFIRRETWLSYESKIVHKLLTVKSLIPVSDDSKNSRGVLKLAPKGELIELNYRPLVSIYKDLSKKDMYKKITAKIYHAARKMNEFSSGKSLFHDWKNFREIISPGTKMYAVKLDIKDAYGSIDINLLCRLIANLDCELLNDNFKTTIVDHVTNQFVTFRNKNYQWKRGLLQGDRLSSCLCELYMAYLDKTFLSKFKESGNFLHRTVDDYFFCTTQEHQIYNFISAVQSVHTINPHKTKTDSSAIPYCGKLINVENGQVRTLYLFEKHYSIRHKFKLWNYNWQISPDKVREFFRRAMCFSYNNNNFDSILLNTIFNSEQTVLENFFDSMICLAYKFDVAMMAMKSNPLENVEKFVVNTVREYASRIFKKLQMLQGQFDQKNITYHLLEVVGFRAFILVFKKRNEYYKHIVAYIEAKHKLHMVVGEAVNFRYFTKIPDNIKNVKMNRKCIL